VRTRQSALLHREHGASLTLTGVDLAKILGGQTKTLGEKVVKSDKYMGDSQLLGARIRAAP